MARSRRVSATVWLIGGALQPVGAGGLREEGFAARFTGMLTDKAGQWGGFAEPSDLRLVRPVVTAASREGRWSGCCRPRPGRRPDRTCSRGAPTW